MSYSVNLQIVSDIHLEHRTTIPHLPALCDYLCLAGDIGNVSSFAAAQLLQDFLQYCSANWKQVYFVLGNHEWYCDDSIPFLEIYATMLKQFPNIHWLNDSFVDIVPGELRIYGTTLWTSHNTTYYTKPMRGRDMNEYARDQEEALVKYFRTCDVPTIVMTHFPPLQQDTSAPKYRFESKHVQDYFAWENFPSKLANRNYIPAWISGHTHWSYDFRHDNIRFLANQYGYPREEKNGETFFNPTAVFSIQFEDPYAQFL